MDIIQKLERAELPEKNYPGFRVGDTVKVMVKVTEGNKERIQPFQGICIGIRGGGAGKTFRVRKVTSGFGVERIFPWYSPAVESVELIQQGKVRRSKLYYLRDRIGKAASKVKQKKRVVVS